MAVTKDIPRAGISFEEFVEAATAAGVRASLRASAEAGLVSGPKPGGTIRPWPIWLGIIIRPPEDFQLPSNVQQP